MACAVIRRERVVAATAGFPQQICDLLGRKVRDRRSRAGRRIEGQAADVAGTLEMLDQVGENEQVLEQEYLEEAAQQRIRPAQNPATPAARRTALFARS